MAARSGRRRSRRGPSDRPPEGEAHEGKRHVLERADRVARGGRVAQRRRVPEPHGADAHRPGRDGRHAAGRGRRRIRPLRDGEGEEHEGRRDEREQHVLQHVGAEEGPARERVDGRGQGEDDGGGRGDQRESCARAVTGPGARSAAPAPTATTPRDRGPPGPRVEEEIARRSWRASQVDDAEDDDPDDVDEVPVVAHRPQPHGEPTGQRPHRGRARGRSRARRAPRPRAARGTR